MGAARHFFRKSRLVRLGWKLELEKDPCREVVLVSLKHADLLGGYLVAAEVPESLEYKQRDAILMDLCGQAFAARWRETIGLDPHVTTEQCNEGY